MGLLLVRRNATVTICHTKTENMAKVCSEADILVVAAGKPRLVTKEFVKPGEIGIYSPTCLIRTLVSTHSWLAHSTG